MKKLFTVFSLLLFSLASFSQVKDSTSSSEQEPKQELTRKEAKKARPTYIGMGVGFNSSKFRDFATSPLFYRGLAKVITVSRLKYDDKFESNVELTYSFGNYTAKNGAEGITSSVKALFLDYSHLYKIERWSNDKWNIKAGGKLSTNTSLRVNPALQNNQLGIDGFLTLFGAVKVTKDLTRDAPNPKKFLFVNYGKSVNKRTLSFQYNLGLFNSTLRNGYAYTDDESVRNQAGLLAGKEFKAFSGLRMSSALNYTIGLKNKNELMISYVWDAYKTGGDYDKFEMGNHILKFTFLFGTK